MKFVKIGNRIVNLANIDYVILFHSEDVASRVIFNGHGDTGSGYLEFDKKNTELLMNALRGYIL